MKSPFRYVQIDVVSEAGFVVA